MKTKLKLYGLFIAVLFTFSLYGQKAKDSKAPVTEMYQFAVNLNQDYRSLSRFYEIESAPERRERFLQFFDERKNILSSHSFENMTTGGKVDYILISRMIENQIFRLNEEASEYERLKKWVSMLEPIYDIEKMRRRGKHLESQEVAHTFNEIKKKIDVSFDDLEKDAPRFSKDLARRATSILNGHKDALQSVYKFYNGYDPNFSWWVKKPSEALMKNIDLYSEALNNRIDVSALPEDDGSGIIGNPIGRTELIRQLKLEMIPYTPEELVDIANKEFAWCDAELLKASREMGFGDDWKAAQEKVKMSFVPEGYQPEAMLELYDQSIDFLKKNNLLTIPPIAEETWRMSMISAERQRISPFFLGGEVLQISYPTDEMEHDEKLMSMRGNNPHFSRSTVHHELIAGHHLQGFVNRRNHEYRNFRTPFWTEGWALYWELILWDMDFPRSPEDRIGMLFWRMHRCARIIFSLNYHLGNWTPQECIDYLVDRVGHERANAEGEVRRSFEGNYGPLYQIAYMVGGMQFYALKKELVESGKMTYKEFHDAVLNENAMPVEMVRAILTDQNLKKEFKSNWRFYDK